MSKISTTVLPDTGSVCVTSNGRSGFLPSSATPDQIKAFGTTLGLVGTIVNQESSALSACLLVCKDVAERLHGDDIRPIGDDGEKLDESEILPSFYSGPQLSKCRAVVAAAGWMDRPTFFGRFTTLDPAYRFANSVSSAVKKNPSRENLIRAAIISAMGTAEVLGFVDAEYSKSVLKLAAESERGLVKTAHKIADSEETKADRAKRARRLESAEPAAVADLAVRISTGNDAPVQALAILEAYRARSVDERAAMFSFYSDLLERFEALDLIESTTV